MDDLQKTVEETFSTIPDRGIEIANPTEHPYGTEQLQRWIEIVPQKQNNIRTLILTFPLPK